MNNNKGKVKGIVEEEINQRKGTILGKINNAGISFVFLMSFKC